jgi:hypothetical protein
LAAVKLYRAAFQAEPHLADDVRAGGRYLAARSAVQAGGGHGPNPEPLSDQERRGLRDEARAWLRADLAFWAHAMPGGKKNALAQKTLGQWLYDLDFAVVRDDDPLENLAPDERQQWRQLWTEVAALMQKK